MHSDQLSRKTSSFGWTRLATLPTHLRERGLALCLLLLATVPLFGRAKEKEKLGLGFSVEVTASEVELVEAVQEVVGDGIIQGSKEYDKDPYVTGASEVESSPLFPKWSEPGQLFYKVRTDAIAPRNFDASAASGTLAVRYVVQPKDATRSILRIDAVYVESEHRFIHPSNGTVETSEYKDIQDHVEAIQLKKRQAIEGEKNRQEEVARRALEQSQEVDAASLAVATSSAQGIEQRVQDLRRQLERAVRASGAQLKAAPYGTAASLKSLAPGTEVVILVVSPYWLGVETQDGLHGWIHRNQLGPLQ
jgi:hypothetical protein